MMPDAGHAPRSRTAPRCAAAAWALLALAAALRVPALFHDLWLDEIWAARIARGVTRLSHVFTGIHFDTNHWIYTIYLTLWDADAPEFLLRLPSFLAGLLLLGAFWQLRDRAAGWFQLLPLLLAGVSFVLVAYAGEARGYALLMAAGVIAYALKDRWLRDGRLAALLGFWAACIVGFLSHLTFTIPFAAMGLQAAWTLLVLRGDGRPEHPPAARFLARTAAAYGVPSAVFGWLYFVDVRHIQHGGGDDLGLLYVFGRLAADIFGLPNERWALLAAGAGLLVLAGFSLYRVWRADRGEAGFFALVLIVLPAGIVLLKRGDFEVWYPRHFIVCVPFFYLLLGRVVAAERRRRPAIAAVLLLCASLMATLNLARTVRFWRMGRGDYRAAVRHMAARTAGDTLRVSSDHDFRNGMLLEYAQRCLPAGKHLQYVPQGQVAALQPEWFIVHATERNRQPAVGLMFRDGTRYRLSADFPFDEGPFGFQWSVYRLVGR